MSRHFEGDRKEELQCWRAGVELELKVDLLIQSHHLQQAT